MTTPPPPPSPPCTNYVMFGLLGLFIGLAIVVVVLLLSSDSDPASATTITAPSTTEPVESTTTTLAATTTTAPSTSTSTTSTTAAPAFPGDTDDKVADGPLFGTFAFLADVRFAQRDEGFTRVVFDFEGTEVPWWAVAYTSGPFTTIGDEPVPIAGDAFLKVDLSSTSFDLSGEEVRITYEGPDRIDVDTTSVIEVVVLEDFEGVSSWVIGVTGEKPFLVGTLTDPPRVFIDIQD